MQDRRDAGVEGCRSGGMQEWRDARVKGRRQEWRDAEQLGGGGRADDHRGEMEAEWLMGARPRPSAPTGTYRLDTGH